MARTRVGGKRKGPRDPTKEARIQAAIQDTLTGVHGSFRSAAIAHNVPPQTVRDRAAGKHRTRRSFLNESQEKVLVDWCHHNSDSATPLHPRKLRAQILAIILDFRRYMVQNDALAGLLPLPLPLPTQLRMKTQHLQQVLLSPRQPTICSTRSHHFFRKCKDLSPFLIRTTYIMLAPLYSQQPLLSYLHHHSHCCLGILIVSLFITPATRNTYSIRLLHTSHWYTRIYLPNI
ncbi:uncharacterized protein EDB91DRAFT_866929 [Suillus paluster]|uniref:uncharacterized protein n=1 Tax=Suillus paluster TaxID=48578 RepID=UPI001B86C025|nr:uncharacterized protein EDB91DRAFT_866929 [Suillus paluster]KAG1728171.1 hypothetical protein EDB91DRAFT_866929 [Suillus paluster]